MARGFTFDIVGKRENDFTNGVAPDAPGEFLHTKGLGANVTKGREFSTEDVVGPLELPGTFHRNQIRNVFNNTNRLPVTTWVRINRAAVTFRQITGDRTATKALGSLLKGCDELLPPIRLLDEQVQGNSLCGAVA